MTTRDLEALDLLHGASRYLAAQFCADGPHDLVVANLQAQQLLFNAQQAILRANGIAPVSRLEVQHARARKRGGH